MPADDPAANHQVADGDGQRDGYDGRRGGHEQRVDDGPKRPRLGEKFLVILQRIERWQRLSGPGPVRDQ